MSFIYILKISRHKLLIVLKDPGEMEFIFYFISDSSIFSQGFSIINTVSVALYSNKFSLHFRCKIKLLFTGFVRQLFCLFWKNTLIVQTYHYYSGRNNNISSFLVFFFNLKRK